MMRRAFMVVGLVSLWPAAAVGWSLEVEQGRIGMALPDIQSGSWAVTGSKADVLPSITASGESAVIDFTPTSMVVTDRLAYTGSGQTLVLEDLRSNLSNVTLTLDYATSGSWPARIAVNGDVRIDAGRVEHPQLIPQSWTFQGSAEGRLENLRIQGTLFSSAGFETDLLVRVQPGGTVSVSVSSLLEGQKDVSALSGTFAGWPELLTVDSGMARVSVELSLGPEGRLKASGDADLEKVAGVYNRTAFSGVTGGLLASLADDWLTVRFRELTAEQLNPGIPVSAIRFTGDYRAPIAETLQGRLEIQQARARFLEGTLRIPPGVYDLSGSSGQIPVEVQGISLGRLMEVYPAERLEGSGLLSGRIPISFGPGGVQVSQGQISAQSPGGRLQLPAEKLQGMMRGNQTMDLVVKALQNFHYSVLSSTLDYDETGKLTLDLRLEGKNPELQGGHPVVLNVNLEEDIPALLTSLQLTGRVNEAVTERVRTLLQGPDREQESGKEAVP